MTAVTSEANTSPYFVLAAMSGLFFAYGVKLTGVRLVHDYERIRARHFPYSRINSVPNTAAFFYSLVDESRRNLRVCFGFKLVLSEGLYKFSVVFDNSVVDYDCVAFSVRMSVCFAGFAEGTALRFRVLFIRLYRT